MKNNTLIRIAFYTLILTSIIACQQFSYLKTTITNNQLTFDFNDFGDTTNKSKMIILNVFSVSKTNCNETCVIWEIVREEKYFDTNDLPLVTNTLKYGQTPEGMKTNNQAKPLLPGQYSVTGSASLLVNDKFVESQKIFYAFKLRYDETNNISLVKD